MRKKKNKISENSKGKQQKFDNAVNVVTNSFDLKRNSLDHERRAEDIGYTIKR